MKVIEPGHKYQLNTIDGGIEQVITFVNREPGTEHPGTQTQEVLRACIAMMEVLIDRTNHCDGCMRWEGNDRIVKSMSEAQRQMRLSLVYHEQRAMERKVERGELQPESVPVDEGGHFEVRT